MMGEPVAVLNGIEEEEVLRGHADPAEAQADMALKWTAAIGAIEFIRVCSNWVDWHT